ncbi:MAG: HAMP domain-containing histidine kinase, partial [Mailhella sp.]|nr:HAMP domain-containing histidine kinase [Mailhella sp.]
MAFLGGEFQRTGVEVQSDLGPDLVILGDPDLLYRAFYNILANAQQAMQGAGRIVIEGSRNQDGHTRIRFCDTGPGFGEDVLKKAL